MIGGTCPGDTGTNAASVVASVESSSGATTERALNAPFDGQSLTGNYLASQFAQRHHDWTQAGRFMANVMELSPKSTQLMSKSMVLAMGAGEYDKAIYYAQSIIALEKDNALALLFLAIDSFHRKEYAEATSRINQMPEGTLSEFIRPLLQSWSKAATGVYDTADLHANTIHINHAVLIADFMNKRAEISDLLQLATGAESLTIEDIERIADSYVHIGSTEKAAGLYARALEEWPDNPGIIRKLKLLEAKTTEGIFQPVSSPEQGVALALNDMATLLFQEYSDESARVFANMALFLVPDMTDAALVLARITARNERYDDAIAYFQQIDPKNIYFLEARRQAAALMKESNRTDEALAELESLFRDYQDLEALIEIGDIYRQDEDFDRAVIAYNKVESSLQDPLPREYWHLYYLRGMSYEQLGQWDKAEADLKTALEFQPENPFVLNYLGYAWADKGVNLKQSMDMIRRAVALRPEDGYITDSLGWVLYRLGNYEEAVPHLERAVELLPYDSVINDHLGDAYWRVGRRLEARFQWMRAKNHSDDEILVGEIDRKLDQGLQSVDIVKEASSQASGINILKP